jgi:hypothetical protein
MKMTRTRTTTTRMMMMIVETVAEESCLEEDFG